MKQMDGSARLKIICGLFHLLRFYNRVVKFCQSQLRRLKYVDRMKDDIACMKHDIEQMKQDIEQMRKEKSIGQMKQDKKNIANNFSTKVQKLF